MSSVASVVLLNQRREIERLAEVVEQFGKQHNLSAEDVANINLVLDEIVINVIKHGYDDEAEHRIAVDLRLEGAVMTIQVEDDGQSFNPLDAPLPNLDVPIAQRPVGGLGIHIVRSLASAMAYRREGDRNVLTIQMRMAGA